MPKKGSIPVRIAAILIIIIAVLVLISLPRNDRDAADSDSVASPELTIAAEDLNNVLPQRVALSTYFDSVGVNRNSMSYYYSVEDLSEYEFLQKGLRDSLMSEAEGRIPCTLWRPVYMQGVDVSFIYFSNEGREILRFTKSQNACCDSTQS